MNVLQKVKWTKQSIYFIMRITKVFESMKKAWW